MKRHYSVLSNFEVWNNYGDQMLAEQTKRTLEDKGYTVKVKAVEDARHNLRWVVYYRY